MLKHHHLLKHIYKKGIRSKKDRQSTLENQLVHTLNLSPFHTQSFQSFPMDADQFRIAGKQLIDYIADYIESLRTRPVLPDVKPGYINDVVPSEAPEDGEPWIDMFNDIEEVVMKGVSLNNKICK